MSVNQEKINIILELCDEVDIDTEVENHIMREIFRIFINNRVALKYTKSELANCVIDVLDEELSDGN